jgi:hypothetical protein
MNLISVIKIYSVFICFAIVTSGVMAQNTNEVLEDKVKDTITSGKYQKSLIFSVEVFKPYTTENSFIGRGTEAKTSFNLGVQMFIYKNFFIGGFTGASYLQVKDSQFTGNYRRSTVAHSYFNFGYELPINEDLRLGASVALIGSARYKNKVNNSGSVRQIDNAKLNKYGVYLSYKVDGALSIFAGYSYRVDKTKINTAPEIQDNFNTINYHNFSIGIKIYGGNRDTITAISETYKHD